MAQRQATKKKPVQEEQNSDAKILINSCGILRIPLEEISKQYRVLVNHDMFSKSNPKGMALFLHSLLSVFNPEQTPDMYSGCWFPYTLVQMKDFKQISLEIISELEKEGVIGKEILTKAIIETAGGKRMWRALRELADYAVIFTIKSYFQKQAFKALPVFLTNKQEISMVLEDHDQELLNSLKVTNSNVDETILNRNIRALRVHIQSKMQEFNRDAGEIHKKQQKWLEFSTQINELYLQEKQLNQQLKVKCSQKGLYMQGPEGLEESPLAMDLKREGLKCLDRIPQLGEIRQIRDAIMTESEKAYKENEIRDNLDFILPKEQTQPHTPQKQNQTKKPEQVLSTEAILKGVVYQEEREQIREEIKLGENPQITSVNKIVEKELTLLSQAHVNMNHHQLQEAKESNFDNLLNFVDDLIEQHETQLETLKAQVGEDEEN